MNFKNKYLIYFVYALGSAGTALFNQTIMKWYQYFYTPPATNSSGLPVLMPIALIGITMTIGKIFDAVANPLTAYFSDKCTCRFGRRLPFILWGLIPMALTFVLIWHPVTGTESVNNFIYLSIVMAMGWTSFTVVVAPYLALIGDLSATNRDRILLTTLMAIFSGLGLLFAEGFSGIIISSFGFSTMGYVFGILIIMAFIPTLLLVKEKKADTATIAEMNFTGAIKKSLLNRRFITYEYAIVTVTIGTSVLTIVMPYICELMLGIPPEESGIFVGAAILTAMIASLFVPAIVNRYGKKEVFTAAMLIFSVTMLATFFFGSLLNYQLALLDVIIAGIPIAVFLAVPNNFIVDIAEYESFENNGQRREAMYFATQGIIQKSSVAIAALLVPIIFDVFGFSPDNYFGVSIIGPLIGLLVLSGIIAIRKYDLTEKKLDDARIAYEKGENNAQ